MYINLKDFNPVPDDALLNTKAFKDAITSLSQGGGGTLFVPPGKYLVGNICLEDNICLHLSLGAEIIASPHYEHFQNAKSEVVAEGSYHGFIFAKNKINITISGKGKINGNAPSYNAEIADELGYRQPKSLRPRTLIFENCTNITVEDVTVFDSPMWTLHFVSCKLGRINNVNIINSFKYTNTDAIDIDGCSDFYVTNCYLKTADDGVCLKTSKKKNNLDTPCQNIIVSDCIIESHSSALKIGTETYNDFNNIKFTNCVVKKSNRGISIVSRDGGNINNITFDNILIETEFSLPCHWGKADPIYITAKNRHAKTPCGRISDIFISNININSEGAINFHSESNDLVKNINLFHINMYQHGTINEDRGTYDIRPPCNPNQFDNVGMDNAYTILDGETRPWGVYEYDEGLPAIFIKNIKKEDIKINFCIFNQDPNFIWNEKEIVYI